MRRMTATSFLTAVACLSVTAGVLAGQPLPFKDMVGKQAPEIRARKKHVFNAERPPKLKKLRGQVVWLEFSFIH